MSQSSDLSRKKNKKQVINTCITPESEVNLLTGKHHKFAIKSDCSQFSQLSVCGPSQYGSLLCLWSSARIQYNQGYQQRHLGIVQLNDIFHKQAACCCFFYCTSPMPNLHQRTPMWIFIYQQMVPDPIQKCSLTTGKHPDFRQLFLSFWNRHPIKSSVHCQILMNGLHVEANF